MIKFTIVTVTYNAGATVERTFDSVLCQTYPHVEHIVIDGQSKDDTVARAYIYKEVSERKVPTHEVRIVSEPDRGIYDAMNKGLALATGDYICFLNAGDALYGHDTLDRIYWSTHIAGLEIWGDDLPAVLYGQTEIIDGNGKSLGMRRLKAPDLLTWRSFRLGMLVCHQAFYARLDMVKDIHYDLSYRFSADVDWCIRVMKEAERRDLAILYTGLDVARYLKEGTTTANHRASLMERFAVMRRHYGLFCTVLMHLWFVIRAPFKW